MEDHNKAEFGEEKKQSMDSDNGETLVFQKG